MRLLSWIAAIVTGNFILILGTWLNDTSFLHTKINTILYIATVLSVIVANRIAKDNWLGLGVFLTYMITLSYLSPYISETEELPLILSDFAKMGLISLLTTMIYVLLLTRSKEIEEM